MYKPGNGVGVGKVFLGAALAVTAAVGLGVGLGLEGSKLATNNHKLSNLQKEIDTNYKITNEINVKPPSGGFIN